MIKQRFPAALGLAMALAAFIFCLSIPFSACKKTQETMETAAPYDPVVYYQNLIEKRQQTGHSVFFKKDGEWVENPGYEWLDQYFNGASNEVTSRAVNYFTIEMTPTNGAKLTDLILLLDGQEIHMAANCFSSGNTYVEDHQLEIDDCYATHATSYGHQNCNVSGSCHLVITRHNGAGCFCSEGLNRTFSLPTPAGGLLVWKSTCCPARDCE